MLPARGLRKPADIRSLVRQHRSKGVIYEEVACHKLSAVRALSSEQSLPPAKNCASRRWPGSAAGSCASTCFNRVCFAEKRVLAGTQV